MPDVQAIIASVIDAPETFADMDNCGAPLTIEQVNEAILADAKAGDIYQSGALHAAHIVAGQVDRLIDFLDSFDEGGKMPGRFALRLLARTFARQLASCNAKSFVRYDFSQESGPSFTVTIQVKGGREPAEVLAEQADQAVEKLNALAAVVLKGALDLDLIADRITSIAKDLSKRVPWKRGLSAFEQQTLRNAAAALRQVAKTQHADAVADNLDRQACLACVEQADNLATELTIFLEKHTSPC